MNILFVISLIVGSSLATLHEEFHKFKVEYSKSYSNKIEEEYRKSIFAKNVKLINDHNIKYEKGESTFYLGINHMSDMTVEEAFSCFLHPNNTNNLELHQFDPKEEYPEAIDWSQKGVVTPVKKQYHCGSCWSFSTTGVLESAWAIKTGQLLSLSEQNLVDCVSDQYSCYGCDGGIPAGALQYIQQNGIDSEQQYPYTSFEHQHGPCRPKQPDNQVRVQGVRSIPYGSEQGLQSALTTVGPISVAIAVSELFKHYTGGLFEDSTCQELNHAVLVVGFGKEAQSGKDYWLVKNSWGPAWGEQGYIRMAKGYNICGIANSACYPVV